MANREGTLMKPSSDIRQMEPQKAPYRVVPKQQRRRRYRYRHKHMPHYYLVLIGISCAGLVCLINLVGLLSKSVLWAQVAFAAEVINSLVIFTAFFCGFFMLMSGHIPLHRLKYLLPHGAVGVLTPLLYTVNVSISLEGLGSQPVKGAELGLSLTCLAILAIQFSMGKAVVHREPLHLVKPIERSL
jgi:uncharacterized membrane protein